MAYSQYYNTPENQASINGPFPVCNCDPPVVCIQRQVKKEGPNNGRWFYCCATSESMGGCKKFQWEDGKPSLAPPNSGGHAGNTKILVESNNELLRQRTEDLQDIKEALTELKAQIDWLIQSRPPQPLSTTQKKRKTEDK